MSENVCYYSSEIFGELLHAENMVILSFLFIGITIHFPFFNGHSYVEYAAIPFNNVINTIVLTFRTTSSNGMLLYAGHQTYRDFILLRVANGVLEFTFNAGAETVSMTTSERVDTGVLTTIIAK